MLAERTGFEAEKSIVYSAVDGLLNNPAALEFAKKHRLDPLLVVSQQEVEPSILGAIEDVYLAFEPRSSRIIEGRMAAFSSLREEEREDILGNQKIFLFKLIYRFRWESYKGNGGPDHAIAAFTNYLVKATGSFPANKTIDNQRDVSTSSPLAKRKFKHIVRPVEDSVVEKELEQSVLDAIKLVSEETSQINVQALMDHISGKSVKEMATEAQVSVPAMKKRLKVAKHTLIEILKRKDVLGLERSLLAKDVRYFHANRKELLETRREVLLARYDKFKDIVPEKALLAAKLFYGLDGLEPLYDYQKVSEVSGMSLNSVRVSVSQITRMMLKVTEVSSRVLEQKHKLDLYNFWLSHQDDISLNPIEAKVLNLYFGKKLFFAQIGRIVGFSEETARRNLNRALNRIRITNS